jgi:predicted Zn-dependent protease
VNYAFCDFTFQILNDPKQPPNAYQSIGKNGSPVITFNINMLRTVKNDHEIAFIMGHEAGHQIAQHINQKVGNANAGALIGGILMASIGADPQAGMDLGGMIGGQAYSKKFELQADRIGAHLASRAGYDPLIGAESFRRTQGSNSLLSTHPPSYDRIQTVENTTAAINAARARGEVAPITW